MTDRELFEECDRIRRELLEERDALVGKLEALLYQYDACHAEKDAQRIAARRVLDAFDRCDSNRGWLSCVDDHDLRCARLLAVDGCVCGADELRAALEALEQLTPPTPAG